MADNDTLIRSDSPVNDDLMFWSIVGLEGMSQPSTYELRVLSKNDAISAKDILGHGFDVVMKFDDADGAGHERHCRGHAVRFARRGKVGRYHEYAIGLKSWFWLLTKRFNARIFQGQNVLQVIDATIEDSPIKRLKKINTDGVVGQPDKRPYCVQFQESDFTFLSRLMEEEGIYYWFDAHDAPGTMYLSNASDVAHPPMPAGPEMKQADNARQEVRFNEFRQWFGAALYESGAYASHDSDFKAIRKKLNSNKKDAAEHELSDLEVFEFPGGHLREADTDHVARIRMEALAARRRLYWAGTPWPDVAVGLRTRFHTIHEVADLNQEHLIVSCMVVASHPGYEGTDTSAPADVRRALIDLLQDDRVNAEHREELTAVIESLSGFERFYAGMRQFLYTTVPVSVPFRPPRTTPRMRMPGPQSAIVVGPEGDEIHADEFGRVKVHFHWDRYDESNEKSTCWVRVSQPWAGKGWGGYFIPRIGQEVIVDFLNGDPDRPVIMGRVYNDDQPIPFDKHEQSGFRTRSTPDGNASNCNEFRFDDSKGKEQVYLHAEKNQDIEVENDETHWVGHDRKKTVDNDEINHIKNNRTETVDVDETIDIGGNRAESVGGNEDISVGGNRTENVGGNESVTIGANRSLTVSANETVSIGASRTESIGAGLTQTVGAAVTQTVGAALTQTVGGAVTIASGGPMTLNAAGGLNIIAPGGTKVVDFQFLQFGGDEKVGYATSLNFSLINTEINAVKGEYTSFTNALIPVKFEKVGLENKEAAAEIKALAASIASGATKIVSKAISMFL
ncbi:type VI secretion system Vgr family protein [Xenophilus azovorans]|uniref:type VI secretion system Vgr family protein n=1 Tax=Xenophilus azovorans TaxID=151755 RepID=UPI00068993ED|nr:type VI secretion system tip protein TssI/VgrG [Xenophilus azovorans]